MAKQFNFNNDMEKYLDKKKEKEKFPNQGTNKKTLKIKNNEQSVSELYPELDDEDVKIHIIKKENKVNIMLKEYKKKFLEMLRKEEKEIEELEIDEENNSEAEEVIEEIEEIEDKEQKERKTFSKKFRDFIDNTFFRKSKEDESDYDEELIEEEIRKSNQKKSSDEIQDEIEEEIEEEIMEEDINEEKKFSGWINNIMIKMGLKGNENSSENEYDDLESSDDDENDKRITKLILYKAQMDSDVKLALMIANKYMRHLKFEAHKKYEESGDKDNFEEILKKLKIN